MTNLAENLTATAQRFPDRPAIKLDDMVLTWSDVQAGAQRVAGMLRSKGIGPGDRVAVFGAGPVGLMAALSGCGGAANGQSADSLTDVSYVFSGVLTVCTDSPYAPFVYEQKGKLVGRAVLTP